MSPIRMKFPCDAQRSGEHSFVVLGGNVKLMYY